MDPNIIPSQIPTGVNKIKVSCLLKKGWCNTKTFSKRENTGIAKKGAGF